MIYCRAGIDPKSLAVMKLNDLRKRVVRDNYNNTEFQCFLRIMIKTTQTNSVVSNINAQLKLLK